MSKLIKQMISDELQSRYSTVDSAVWIDFVGVDGLTNSDFRRGLHGKKMKLEVVKTALLRRAVAGKPIAKLADAMEGPAALITGGASSVEIAKVLKDWEPKLKSLKLRGAIMEGEFIGEPAVKDLAKMPTKRDIQAQVASATLSPGSKLAGAIKSPGGRIAGAIKALIEKLEKGESAAPADAAASA